MTIENTVGENLRRIRNERGFTQEYVATKLSVPQSAVSNWERGIKLIGTEYLAKIAKLYEVSTDEILGMESKPLKATA